MAPILQKKRPEYGSSWDIPHESNSHQLPLVDGKLSGYGKELLGQAFDAALFEHRLALFKEGIRVIALHFQIVDYLLGPVVTLLSKLNGIKSPLLYPQT